jgi:hypothetical protein
MEEYRKIKCFFILLIIVICSCKNQDKTVVLCLDDELSTVQEKNLIRDSIVIHYYSSDSILLLKYFGGHYKRTLYFNMNDVFFERRKRATEVGEYLGIDSILTFSKQDSIFEYKSARRFYPLVQDYSFGDCIYTIKYENNEYMTIKQSTIDTTYKEIFFYDKDYNIYKYVNMWQNNECVYVRRE